MNLPPQLPSARDPLKDPHLRDPHRDPQGPEPTVLRRPASSAEEALFAEDVEEPQSGRDRVRRWLMLAAALLALLAFTAFLVQRARAPGPVAPPSGPPAVSVVVPGTTLVADRVRVTGTIAARRDMPVGVVGEGGRVERVLVDAGDRVSQGQPLVVLDQGVQRAQLAQLQAAVAQAEAERALARSELNRAQALVERGFISRADIERRQATLEGAEARVALARAQVAELNERLRRMTIRAPAGGLVLARNVEAGQVVSAGSPPLVRLAEGGVLELRANLAEQDLALLRRGQPVEVVPSGGAPITGTVWLIEPLIDEGTRLGRARIALPPGADGIYVGAFATAEIEGPRMLRPLLPQSAVLVDDRGAHVYVVDEGNIARRRDVRLGRTTAEGVSVIAGLTGNERVVASAGAFLRPGETVRPVLQRLARP